MDSARTLTRNVARISASVPVNSSTETGFALPRSSLVIHVVPVTCAATQMQNVAREVVSVSREAPYRMENVVSKKRKKYLPVGESNPGRGGESAES